MIHNHFDGSQFQGITITLFGKMIDAQFVADHTDPVERYASAVAWLRRRRIAPSIPLDAFPQQAVYMLVLHHLKSVLAIL